MGSCSQSGGACKCYHSLPPQPTCGSALWASEAMKRGPEDQKGKQAKLSRFFQSKPAPSDASALRLPELEPTMPPAPSSPPSFSGAPWTLVERPGQAQSAVDAVALKNGVPGLFYGTSLQIKL